VREQIIAAIKRDEDMHMKVLQYVPVDLEAVGAVLRAASVRFTASQLVDALNSESITYVDAKQQGSRVKRRKKGT